MCTDYDYNRMSDEPTDDYEEDGERDVPPLYMYNQSGDEQ